MIYYVYLIPLFLGAIFSLRSFRLKWPSPFRQFSIFLFATLLVEVFANAWKFFLHKWFGYSSYSNLWIYNIYLAPQYMFYLYFYRQVLTGYKVKKVISRLFFLYPLFAITNMVWIQGPDSVNNYTIIVSHLLTIFLTVIFFIEVLKEKEIYKLGAEPLVFI